MNRNLGDYKGTGIVIYTPTQQEKDDNQYWNLKILAANIRKLRKEKGYSQTDLGIIAGVQTYQISHLEGDGYYNVTLRTVGLIARAFGVPLSVLLTDNLR